MFGDEFSFETMDEDDLLYAIIAMDILLRSGASIETAIEYVSAHDYGMVSTEFKRAIIDVRNGKYLERALQESGKRVKNDLYREMIRAVVRSIVTSSGSANTLRQLSLRETQIRRSRYGSFLESVRGMGEMFIIIGALIPLILGVVGVTSDIMASSGLPNAPDSGAGAIVPVALFGTGVLLTAIVVMMKVKAPKV